MGLLMDMASNGSKWVYGLELASYDNKKRINKHILFHGLCIWVFKGSPSLDIKL